MTMPEMVMMIGLATTSIVSIINAVAGGWGRAAVHEARKELERRDDVQSVKLDAIHDQTDGHLSAITEQLKTANDRIDKLEHLFLGPRTPNP